MTIMTIKVLLEPNRYRVNFFDQFEIEIRTQENLYDLDLNDFFEVALRENPKRSFLFVSKLLGKHLPVRPEVPRYAGNLLAMLLDHKIHGIAHDIKGKLEAFQDGKVPLTNIKLKGFREKTLVIGFAETATGLGHGVSASFEENVFYLQTSRENIQTWSPLFSCQEVHSHDVDHACYSRLPDLLEDVKRIVIVDDEITTGKTALSLIQAIHEKLPNLEYFVCSILDFRKDEHRQEVLEYGFQKKIGITFISFIQAEVIVKKDFLKHEKNELEIKDFSENGCETFKEIFVDDERHIEYTLTDQQGNFFKRKNWIYSGKLGITHQEIQEGEELCIQVAQKINRDIKGGRVLCLGFNEFIYIPSRVASYIQGEVFFHSTTRSPIKHFKQNNYCIQSKIIFRNPYEPSILNYSYNIENKDYDYIFVFLEDNISTKNKEEIASKMRPYSKNDISFVIFSQ
jgi:hypothetical protein